MSKYLYLFETESEFTSAYTSEDYDEPWLSYTIENGGSKYNKSKYEKLLGTPLTFKIISGGTINWKALDANFTKTIEYKKNDEDWVSITSSTGASTTISVNAGDIVQIKGDNRQCGKSSGSYNTFSGSTIVFEAEGNIMSLIDSTGYAAKTTLQDSFNFYRLFMNCRGLTSAENVIFPATALTQACYDSMFASCTTLTVAPELPATTLAPNCYQYMFINCVALATSPVLPATTLAQSCYSGMFGGCTGLTIAPELPATALTTECYSSMFRDCKSLTTAPKLPATALEYMCYCGMFSGCTNLTAAPELPATALTYGCYQTMFAFCTNLVTAPELPATTLATHCYSNMFSFCTNLSVAPSILPATTLVNYCYNYMFYYCTSLMTAPELPATILVNNCCQGMFNNCTSLNYIKCLATDMSANSCTNFWVYRVQINSGTFVKASGADWSGLGGNDGIPANWTVVDA